MVHDYFASVWDRFSVVDLAPKCFRKPTTPYMDLCGTKQVYAIKPHPQYYISNGRAESWKFVVLVVTYQDVLGLVFDP